jgi:hypothetical protein
LSSAGEIYPAVLFIGARNDGSIEGTANLDSLQQTYTKKLAEVYPPIPTSSRIVSHQGASCLAIVVQGSADRPHFPCHALMRVGSETKNASDSEVRRMLDERVDKVYVLRQWVGMQITVDKMNLEHIRQLGAVANSFVGVMTECNRFWLTVEHHDVKESIPLRRVEPSYDHQNNRPKIEVPVI